MKKLFAFAAALVLSVSMFASRAVVPTDADLADYATGTYTMCIFNDGACNDIVLNGTYAGWPNDGAGCLTFAPVDGFEGWYVVSWDDEKTDPAVEKGVQAKPVQLDGSGTFNWDYQIGKDAELIRGTATLDPTANNNTEVDITNIGAGIVVIEVKSWKNNPCTAIYHNYKITLVSPDCNEDDYITPAISGGFNGWAQEAMTMDELATAERQNKDLPGAVYTISFKAAEGSEYKFRSAEEWGKDWSNELKEYNAEEDSWSAFNGGQNLKLDDKTEVVYDLGDPEKYSWNNCEKPDPIEEQEFDYTLIFTNIPECEGTVLAVVGGFKACNWTVSEAVEIVDGKATIHAVNTDQFKLIDKAVGDWSNELVGFEQTTFAAADGDADGKIEIDLTDTHFTLECGEAQGFGNVAATKEIKKVVENGQLIMIVDGVRFNTVGARL